MELVGSYIIKDDGTLEKNLQDETMAAREAIEKEKEGEANVTPEK